MLSVRKLSCGRNNFFPLTLYCGNSYSLPQVKLGQSIFKLGEEFLPNAVEQDEARSASVGVSQSLAVNGSPVKLLQALAYIK